LLLKRIALALTLLLTALVAPPAAMAQPSDVFIPSFWNPKDRLEPPIPGTIRVIRFLTDDDYPPFHFIGPDGTLSGFNIELARLICEELRVACTIQPRRWDTMRDALLTSKTGDAIIASYAITPRNLADMAFTHPYYRTPARFLGKTGVDLAITRKGLAGKRIAVIERTAHAAFLADHFPEAAPVPVSELAEAKGKLLGGEADLVFADGVALALWLNGETGRCCRFHGGPYLESAYFGEGVGIATRKDAEGLRLRDALDYALARLARQGRYSTLYLKYFPVSFF
jgi:polar amino acid transport system substrate-binding protein